ncbi:MAG: hypothetical protein GTO63_07985 [Anaerolineae bacterium]|nr:hypothetical protein [Anaerolineae bacterium]NIN94869.1 hypothetical protein [Anaerolineae bacterium]NIQ77920.1 hypothetical protein [Anaerolineae bacterium]
MAKFDGASVMRIARVARNESGKRLGFVDVILPITIEGDDETRWITVPGFKVMKGRDGDNWVSLPSRPWEKDDGSVDWVDTHFFVNMKKWTKLGGQDSWINKSKVGRDDMPEWFVDGILEAWDKFEKDEDQDDEDDAPKPAPKRKTSKKSGKKASKKSSKRKTKGKPKKDEPKKDDEASDDTDTELDPDGAPFGG